MAKSTFPSPSFCLGNSLIPLLLHLLTLSGLTAIFLFPRRVVKGTLGRSGFPLVCQPTPPFGGFWRGWLGRRHGGTSLGFGAMGVRVGVGVGSLTDMGFREFGIG